MRRINSISSGRQGSGLRSVQKTAPKNIWLAAPRAFLPREKNLTRLRDELSAERRALPWEKVDKRYHFTGPNGEANLSDLFAGKSQLVVYHFMLGPDWKEGCKSCSFWADNFDGVAVHLKHR